MQELIIKLRSSMPHVSRSIDITAKKVKYNGPSQVAQQYNRFRACSPLGTVLHRFECTFEGAKRELGFDSSSSTIVVDLGTKPWVVRIVGKALKVALESLFAFGDNCLSVPCRGMANTRIEG